ncbi:MAG: ferritin-like domain-containing protein [Propylenella sp.]
MTETSHDIRTLNSLVATVIDSIEGYEESAKDAGSSRFASMFNDRAAERRQVLTKLQAEVSRLGGNPADTGTTAGAAHRGFVNLKSVVTGQDDKAIINEVERGEDHIKEKFEDALRDNDLSAPTKSVIQECFASVRQGHDQMSALKHSMEATS